MLLALPKEWYKNHPSNCESEFCGKQSLMKVGRVSLYHKLTPGNTAELLCRAKSSSVTKHTLFLIIEYSIEHI